MQVQHCHLVGFAGASLRQAFGLPQREGGLPCAYTITNTLAESAGADFARRLSVLGETSKYGGMAAGEQTAKCPTSMDGRPGATRTPRRNGLDAQPPLCPIPGIEGQGQRQRTGQPKPKGASQGTPPPAPATQASSEGPARRRPNLKPNEERATPTLIEIKCQKCQAYNWTSREVCRSCETPLAMLPVVSSSSNQPLQPVARPPGTVPRQILCGCRRRLPPHESIRIEQGGALQTPGGIGDHHRDLTGRVPFENGAFHSTGLRQRQVERPQAAGSQAQFGDSRGEEGHRQAGEGRGNIETGAGRRLGTSPTPETRAIQESEDAKAAAAPPPPPETHPPGSVSLSSDDVAGLTSFFQELAEEREAAPGAEPPSKKGRVGPYSETPSLKAAKDAAVRAKLERGQAHLGFMLSQSLKSGDGSCQAATQETPLPKGPGKGSGSVPGKGAVEPKDPPPPAPTTEKEKEATQPTQHDEDSDMHDAQVR